LSREFGVAKHAHVVLDCRIEDSRRSHPLMRASVALHLIVRSALLVMNIARYSAFALGCLLFAATLYVLLADSPEPTLPVIDGVSREGRP
jgi:hypothetical protein